MSARAFYRAVREGCGCSHEAAHRGVEAVLRALRDRLLPDEARQVRAQLPAELKVAWGERTGTPPTTLRREAFYARVQREAALGSRRAAREMTWAVFAALRQQLSPGEADDVLAQLPKDLKAVWTEARVDTQTAAR
jgi:uncharacterized protein (DUF2267 family)